MNFKRVLTMLLALCLIVNRAVPGGSALTAGEKHRDHFFLVNHSLTSPLLCLPALFWLSFHSVYHILLKIESLARNFFPPPQRSLLRKVSVSFL